MRLILQTRPSTSLESSITNVKRRVTNVIITPLNGDRKKNAGAIGILDVGLFYNLDCTEDSAVSLVGATLAEQYIILLNVQCKQADASNYILWNEKRIGNQNIV